MFNKLIKQYYVHMFKEITICESPTGIYHLVVTIYTKRTKTRHHRLDSCYFWPSRKRSGRWTRRRCKKVNMCCVYLQRNKGHMEWNKYTLDIRGIVPVPSHDGKIRHNAFRCLFYLESLFIFWIKHTICFCVSQYCTECTSINRRRWVK